MKVVALISGGKDSCYNMMQCVSEGHDIVALANLQPKDRDELDSYMYQTVGHHAVEMYAEAMTLPLYRRVIEGSSKQIGKYYSPTTDDEVEDLYELLKTVKTETCIEGVSVGAILSDYQRVRVENVCQRLGLTSLGFLWRRNQQELMKEMIDCHVESIIIKVAALGLDPKKHLGKSLADIYPHMLRMESDYGLHICGEGGEFETFTLDCPLFKKKLVVDETETVNHSEDAFAPVAYLNLKKLHLEDKPHMGRSEREYLQSLPMTRGCHLLSELFTEEERKEFSETPPCPSQTSKQSTDNIHDSIEVQTFVCQKWFYVTGLVAVSTDGECIEDITRTIMDKLKGTVEKLGKKMVDLVSVCLYVHNMADFARVNSVYKRYFTINPPVRVCVETANPVNAALILDCHGYVADGGDDVKDTMHVQSISHWASANIGPYSQAVHVYNRMAVAGQIALCPASLTIIAGGIVPECRLSLRHVRRVLAAMHPGCSLSNVTNVICYVTSAEFIPAAGMEWRLAVSNTQERAYGEEVCDHEPMLGFVVVPRLPRGAMVEWQVQAYTGTAVLTDGSKSMLQDNQTKISMDYCFNNSENHFFSSKATIVGVERSLSALQHSVAGLCRLYTTVLSDLCLGREVAPMWRVFYPVTLGHYTTMTSVLMEALHGGCAPPPVFSLVPVSALPTEDCLLYVCC
ncbi:uncharacterized protein [Haliotis cracherodii]|uniref:uncharacterized protein n=1 Tax=Haliotis cracherodii TaxID=6455 RepID=UPI0039EA09C1